MADRTFANPSLLRAGSERMTSRVATSLSLLPEYSFAIARFNAAPVSPELATSLDDLSSRVREVLEWLGIDDELLAAFGEALEHADTHVADFDTLPPEVRSMVTSELARLILDGGDLHADADRILAGALGQHAAERLEQLMASGGSMEDWEQLADDIALHADDPAFAVAFVETIGPKTMSEVPQLLAAAWADSDAFGDGWRDVDDAPPWRVLQTISATMATASHTIGEPDGLDGDFFPALFAAHEESDPSYAPYPASVGELGLLLSGGDFSDEALLPAAALAESWLPEYGGWAPGDVYSPWEPFTDPSLTLLPAIAHSPVAAASQPRLLAQLVALGELDEAGLDVAYTEAAAHAAADDDYARLLAEEHADLGLITSEAQGRFVTELQVAGRLLDTVDAAHGTVGGLQGRAADAARELRFGETPEARSRASATLRDTPPWLRSTVESPLYRGAGRALPAAGFGLALITNHQQGQGTVENLTRAGAGFAGGWGGAKLAGTWAAPALAGGPKGWFVYGGALLVGGTAGAFGGEQAVAGFFESNPEDHLWIDPMWADDLPAPGPPSQLP